MTGGSALTLEQMHASNDAAWDRALRGDHEPIGHLRSYQSTSIRKTEACYARGLQRVVVVAATGAGKSEVIAVTAQRFIERNPGKRVLILAHRDELIDQLYKRVRRVMPHLPAGIVKAQRNQTRHPVIVGSIMTLAGRGGHCRRASMIRDVGMVIIDEVHRSASNSYQAVLKHYGCLTPGSGVVAFGVTATMSRADDKSLGDTWQEVAHEIPATELMAAGWLVRPTGIRVYVSDLDLAKVRKNSGGDYQDAALGLAVEQSLAPEKIAKAYREHCPTKQGILFAPTVHSAQVLCDALNAEGFRSVVVSGKTPKGERARLIQQFRDGQIQVLCNAMLFTEGTDLPMCEVVVVARPTRSNGLFIQMVGRGLRLHCPDDVNRPFGEKHSELPIMPSPPCPRCKVGALVLDVCGSTATMRLQAQIELFGEEKRARICRGCEQRPCVCWCDVCDFALKECVCPCEECRMSPCQCEPTPAVPIEEIYDEGELRHAVVDLFTGSAYAWQRTNLGVWFLPAGERLIAVLPAARPNTYDVVSMHAEKPGTGLLIAENVDSLALAQRYAQDNVTTGERRQARRDRAWRAAAPTKALRDAAAAYKLDVSPHATAGEIDALITVAKASFRIDPIAWSFPHIRAAIEIPQETP